MGKLIYSAIASLDGYVADADGRFEWAAPDEEVHRFVNDLERPVGTYIYGRRMYDVMAVWERPGALVEESDAMRDFAAIWQAAEKVVYSRTLESASTAQTRIERAFEPAPSARSRRRPSATSRSAAPSSRGRRSPPASSTSASSFSARS
jgi:dihydrofolate reductase